MRWEEPAPHTADIRNAYKNYREPDRNIGVIGRKK